MAKQAPPLTAEIKTRIQESWKDDLERISDQEQTAVAYIVRRALGEFIARRKRGKK